MCSPARLVLIERILDDLRGCNRLNHLADITMLVLLHLKERTSTQYGKLFVTAGPDDRKAPLRLAVVPSCRRAVVGGQRCGGHPLPARRPRRKAPEGPSPA